MPKIFQRQNSTWTEIKSVFLRQNGSWTEILNVFQRISGSWSKVFSASKIPGLIVAPTITGTGYLYGTLTNNSLGTWSNSPTGYARQWRRGTPTSGGGEPNSYSSISGATSSTYVTTDLDDGQYIDCRITATNALGSNVAVSNAIFVRKYNPAALGVYSLSGVAIVGGTLTALEQIGTWKSTTTISGDTSPSTFEYEWSWSDGTVRQSTAFNSTNSNTYPIVAGDLGKIIRVRVTGTNSGGSDTTGYTSSGTVTSTYSFSFGNTLYVGSNGYIGLDSGGSTAASPGSGRIINIYSGDLVQYKLQEYSDSSNYYLYFRSYNYQSPLVRAAANAVDYQIKFYTGQPYCDIYIVRKGSSVPTQSNGPGYYSSGFTGYAGIPGPYVWSAGSVLRSYFNGTTGSQSALTWTTISDAVWKDITSADIDDSYTAVVTSANQSVTAPSNISSPTLTTDTNNFSAGSTITVNTGTWTGANSYTYELLYSSTTPVATSSSTTTLANTNQYVITNSDATAGSYYFRAKITAWSGAGQTGLSTIAYSSTSSISTIIPSSTTPSLTSATSSGFTIGWTASPTSYTKTTADIYIYNSSLTFVTSVTGVTNKTDGTASSYVWTGGSSGTTYYARVLVYATDTSVTTAFSPYGGSITTTSAPVNTVIPSLSTDTSNFSNRSVITVASGTWTGASSYTYELLYSSSTPVPTNSLTKTLNASNQYTISDSDASNPSYYFRAKVTAYSGASQTGSSAIEYGNTSSRSYINPSTSISVGSATNTGFTITGTASPVSSGIAWVNVSAIYIYNSSQSLIATISSGLPSVNVSTGAWSYTWTGGSSSTTYYAKAQVTATDSAVSTFTTSFSSSITTTAAFVTPTPSVPPSFVFSRNLNGATSTTRRNWLWNVSSGTGSYSYFFYELHFFPQTSVPATGAGVVAAASDMLTFGSSGALPATTDGNTFNYSGTATPAYRTFGRGSSYAGTNGNTIAASSAVSWGKARFVVVGTNATTYNGTFTGYL
jgi:hypothetical protein